MPKLGLHCIFSRKSDFRIVCLSQKPLSLSELFLSTIKPIHHLAYWPSSLLTIEPINHLAYQASSLMTIKHINLWSSFATFKPFGLFMINVPTNFFAYVQSVAYRWAPSSLHAVWRPAASEICIAGAGQKLITEMVASYNSSSCCSPE